MSTLRVLPLGGLGEIGKNMTVLEYGDTMVLVDAGVRFPAAEMNGVDLVPGAHDCKSWCPRFESRSRHLSRARVAAFLLSLSGPAPPEIAISPGGVAGRSERDLGPRMTP